MFSNWQTQNIGSNLGQGIKMDNLFDKGIKIEIFNLQTPTTQVDRAIFNQLKIFDEMIKQNQSTTIALLQSVENVTNALQDINTILTKNTSSKQDDTSVKLELNLLSGPFIAIRSVIEDQIISKIFGTHKYKYQLRLTEPMQKTLYKQRNFSLNVKMIDNEGRIVNNSNRIPITFDAYYNQKDPKMIKDTRLKNSIFKGNNQSQVHHGLCSLTKLQFKEVSSFYSNDGIFFVMYAKQQSLKDYNNAKYQQQVINYNEIKPMIIRNIFVKAKKR